LLLFCDPLRACGWSGVGAVNYRGAAHHSLFILSRVCFL